MFESISISQVVNLAQKICLMLSWQPRPFENSFTVEGVKWEGEMALVQLFFHGLSPSP